ncbi:MAG: hypothetical protein ABH883_03960, partial [Candidatus Omnitrophota bacterium]
QPLAGRDICVAADDSGISGGFNLYQDLNTDLRDGLIDTPADIALARDVYPGNNGKVIVYIQDAHCDYEAQSAIRNILGYYRGKYGVKLLCLEGGAGPYDLRMFTGIAEKDVREKTTDFFVRQGMLNGAEAASAMDPYRYLIWGVEDPGLYGKNLEVYRLSARHGDEIKSAINSLARIISEMKRKTFSKGLMELDEKMELFREEKIEFREYLSYLTSLAGNNGIDMKDYMNIQVLDEVMKLERSIDFKAANRERDEYVERLNGRISVKEKKDLAVLTAEFRASRVAQREYYSRIIEAGRAAGVDMENLGMFRDFVKYTLMFGSVDKTVLMKELSALEGALGLAMCGTARERELLKYGRNFMLMKKAFAFSMTKEDYEYFTEHMKGSPMSGLIAFIEKESPALGIDAAVPEEAEELDARLEDVGKFYEYSFERDEVFLRNLDETMERTGLKSAFLVAGGFHSQNLERLFREKGYSYISLLPVFKAEEENKNPYFRILGGGSTELGSMVSRAVESFGLQVPSLWNRLGLEMEGEKAVNSARVQVLIAEKLVSGEEAVLEVQNTRGGMTKRGFVVFTMPRSGGVNFRIEPVEEGRAVLAASDVKITDNGTMDYRTRKEVLDQTLDMASVTELNRDSTVIKSVEGFLSLMNRMGVTGREIPVIKEAEGILYFRSSANGRGVYVDRTLSAEEKGAEIVENMCRMRGLDAELVKRFKALYEKYVTLGIDRPSVEKIRGELEKEELSRVAEEKTEDAVTAEGLSLGMKGKVNSAFSAESTGKFVLREEDIDKLDYVAGQSGFMAPGAFGKFLRKLEIRSAEEVPSGEIIIGKNNTVYISEALLNASCMVPEAVTMVILSVMSTELEYLSGLEMKNPVGVSLARIMNGLSRDKTTALREAYMETGSLTGPDGIAAKAEELNPGLKFTARDIALIKSNLAVIEGSNGAKLGEGLLSKVFNKAGDYQELIESVIQFRGDKKTKDDLAEKIYALHPRAWVVFADVMAGKAREKYLGGKVMDTARPRATKEVIKFARERGVFMFDFGSDEHAFMFPETFTEEATREFFYNMTDVLTGLEETGDKLYMVQRDDVKDMDALVKSRLVFDRAGSYLNILTQSKAEEDELFSVISGEKLKRTKLYAFLLPVGAVRLTEGKNSFKKMLDEAESRAGIKWKYASLLEMNDSARETIWDSLTPLQQEIVEDIAVNEREEKAGIGKEEFMRDSDKVLYGLEGLNKDLVNTEEIVLSAPETEEKGQAEEELNMLTEPEKKDDERIKNRDANTSNIIKFYESLKRPIPKGVGTLDDYTTFDDKLLEDLLEAVFSLTKEQAENLPADQRIFMVRGPPIDFYFVIINKDGTVNVINVDIMGQAKGKEDAEKELKQGLGGRDTDYPVKDYRLYPFKAINSYAGHAVADNYILAASIALWNNITKNKKFIKNGQMTNTLIKNILRKSWKDMTKMFAAGEFEKKLEKPFVKPVLEAHMAKAGIRGGDLAEGTDARSGENNPKLAAMKMLERLKAMGAVRKREVIHGKGGEKIGDGLIIREKENEPLSAENPISARLRIYNKEMYEKEYSEAYERAMRIGAVSGRKETEQKNAFLLGNLKRERENMRSRRARKEVEEVYNAALGVLIHIKDLSSPVVIFLPMSVFSSGENIQAVNAVRKHLKDGFGAKNIEVMQYDGKDALKKAKAKAGRILESNDSARAVVYCDAEEKIHPEGNIEKDIFRDFTTREGKPKAYYINQIVDGEEEERDKNRLIGPHIILALSLKEIRINAEKGIETNPALLISMSRLMTYLAGNEDFVIGEKASKDDMSAFLEKIEKLINGKMVMRIQPVDFKTLESKIKAEIEASKSL